MFPSLPSQRPHQRPRLVVCTDPSRPRAVTDPTSVVVIGGGIAGCVAATVLAERGNDVVLLERQDNLGGRLAAWPHRLPDGTVHRVDHGFHGFFRQYYNLRRWLRRLDPGLAFLRPVPSYPVVSAEWPEEDMGRLPSRPPWNLLALLARSPSIRLRDLPRMNRTRALPLLEYHPERTYAQFDHVSAQDLLHGLRLPDRALAMLFEVFSRSFFNKEDEMSAAEMIAMFHFYFLGNPEGLAFDAADADYESSVWAPLAARIAALGGDIRTGCGAELVEPAPAGWRVHCADGSAVDGREVILATDVAALRALLEHSPELAARTGVSPDIPALRASPPYGVLRCWLRGSLPAGRAAFNAVSRRPLLDSITRYDQLTGEASRWARRNAGSVVELHAYALPPDEPADGIARRMRAELARLWPETADLECVDACWRIRQDAPSFTPGSHATRPGVATADPGVHLAGDWVRLPFPAGLMERAAASGVLAANQVLSRYGATPEPVLSIRPHGLLAGRTLHPGKVS